MNEMVDIKLAKIFNDPLVFEGTEYLDLELGIAVNWKEAVNKIKKLLDDHWIVALFYGHYVKIHGGPAEPSTSSADVKERLQQFRKNLYKIGKQNLKPCLDGKGQWKCRLNGFTDKAEPTQTTKLDSSLKSFLAGLPIEKSKNLVVMTPIQKKSGPSPLPTMGVTGHSLDWRNHGVVSGVKDQGKCGSCYAFATVTAIESAHAIKYETQVVELSVQAVVDCSPNAGCEGGSSPASFQFMKDGLPIATKYSYVAEAGVCKIGGMKIWAKVAEYGKVAKNEAAIKAAVDKFGPIVVAVCADNDWFNYDRGILDHNCKRKGNHAVVIVGYGTVTNQQDEEESNLVDRYSPKIQPPTTVDYWIIKNSWGVNWGEDGYLRLRRGKNCCGIADSAFYVVAA